MDIKNTYTRLVDFLTDLKKPDRKGLGVCIKIISLMQHHAKQYEQCLINNEYESKLGYSKQLLNELKFLMEDLKNNKVRTFKMLITKLNKITYLIKLLDVNIDEKMVVSIPTFEIDEPIKLKFKNEYKLMRLPLLIVSNYYLSDADMFIVKHLDGFQLKGLSSVLIKMKCLVINTDTLDKGTPINAYIDKILSLKKTKYSALPTEALYVKNYTVIPIIETDKIRHLIDLFGKSQSKTLRVTAK